MIFYKGIVDMGKTVANRQAAYRKRMKARGYRLVQVWVDAEGFPVKVGDVDGVKKPGLTFDQLKEMLVRVTAGADEAFALRLYGELAAVAQELRKVWDVSRMNQDLFTDKADDDESSVLAL